MDEIFDFCKFHTSDHEKPVITLSSLNILKLEYPLYVSKQWSEETLIGNTPFMIYYEVTSREDIVLDIGGALTLFQCYKIEVDWFGDMKIDFYISDIGIVKVAVEYNLPITTIDEPNGTGENARYIQTVTLTDYNIAE